MDTFSLSNLLASLFRIRPHYNDSVNDERITDDEPIVGDPGTGGETQSPAPDAAAAFASLRRTDTPDWNSGSGPGRRWVTIGCGLGILILVAALFAGSTLMRKTVWTTFATTRQRLVQNLPATLPPGERMQLINQLDAFADELELRDDPYPVMGEFQTLVRGALEDGRIVPEEVAELRLFLDRQLAESRLASPYSMP